MTTSQPDPVTAALNDAKRGHAVMRDALTDLTTAALRAGLDRDTVDDLHGRFLDGNATLKAALTLVVHAASDLGVRLLRIADWHGRETGLAGMVGDYCTECGNRWPCDTRRLAEGTYDDVNEETR